MFKSKAQPLPPETDFTNNLRETSFYRYGLLRSLGLTGDVTAIAVDPILSLFAVGTSSGYVHCFGQSALQFSLPVSAGSTSVPVKGVKFLAFHPGHQRLIIIDDGNTLHTYDLANISDHPNPTTHPPLPVKEISYTLWGTITSIEQPSSSYTHLFFTMKDGTTLAWDLSRRMIGNWKIGNCWHEYEDRMFRSGIPGRQRTAGGPMATCLAINPRDLNIMLIGYEGGVVAWNFQKNAVEKTFEMTLPPGAPGGGSYQDASGSLWTERTPSVSCVSWRPDGQVFAVGHFDGCITFWAYGEPDKPLMVRTITHEDVNVTDADELFSAGVLDKGKPRERDADGQLVISAVSANREPIFKLTWASFPDQASLRLLATAQAADETLEPVSNATMEYAERGETLLLVLGGQSPGEKPGINILQFPAYQPPLSQKARPSSPNSESMPVQERYAYRDSLAPTGSSFYATATPPEDFVLMPRNSPYFNLSLDPIAIFVTLTPDPNIAKPESGRMAERGIEAWAFPPPRSTVIPASPGRKNYVQPGEGEKAVAMTPAPVWTSPQMTPRAASPSAGWRLPWSSGSPAPSPKLPPSPLLRVPTPDSAGSSSSLNPIRARTKIRKRYRLPAQLWSGATSVLTSDIHSLPTPLFKRLITWSIDHAEQDLASRVPLQGGLVVPDLQSHGAPDVKVAKMESYRIMVTSHSDATVRFWDISPHLLLLPSPLHFEYPNPLPHLTISIAEYLKHPDVKHLPLARLWEQDRSKVRIKSVHLAREALECTITMVSGEVIVTKFGEARKGSRHTPDEDEDDSPKDSYFPKTPEPAQVEHKVEYVEEITEIGHLAKWNMDGFKPVAIFTLKRGEPLQCSVSDIGFIAVAFSANSLAILDMRGPDVILREGFDEDGVMVKKRRKKGNVQNVPGETSQVGALQWVVAGLGNDPSPRPRLIVSYVKGMTKIYTLANVLGEWVVEAKPPTFTNESLSFPVASFVIEPLGGAELLPTAEALQGAMQSHHQDKKDGSPHCLWIAVARKSIRIAVNFNGERVSKVEMMEEDISSAFYVTRHGQKVLVIITARGSAVFYSLPFLTLITSLELYYGHQQRPIGRISMDDRSGDFIEHISPIDINLRTLFHFRKPFPPRYDPTHLKRAIPPQPLPLTYSTIGWLMGSGPLTGAQLDTIVAGPSRPPPPKTTPSKPLISWGAAAPSVTWGKPVEKPPPPPPPPRSEVAIKRTAVTKQTGPSRDHREREDAYTEMRNATAERGNYLDTLGDSINNVSISAGNYLSQARNAAVKEAAKGSIKSAFGKLM